MDHPSNGQPLHHNQEAGNTMPAFSGAFDDDSSRRAVNTGGQPVPQQQYVPPMYGQPVPQQQYVPPMYGQPAPQQQYAPPMYGQPVPLQQYVPPMYGQPVQQYAPNMYVQPVPVYQPPALPKEVIDRKLFRKHSTRVGLMLMADFGLMFGVQLVVLIIAVIVIIAANSEVLSGAGETANFVAMFTPVLMLAGGLSAIVGNMLPSSLHLYKWRYEFADPFRGDRLSPLFTLTALLTALGLNSAWRYVYYFLCE